MWVCGVLVSYLFILWVAVSEDPSYQSQPFSWISVEDDRSIFKAYISPVGMNE